MPGASLVAMCRGLCSVGIDGLDTNGPGTMAYTEPRANSGSLFLTPNTETTYGTMFLDLRNGPVVDDFLVPLRRRAGQGCGRKAPLPLDPDGPR